MSKPNRQLGIILLAILTTIQFPLHSALAQGTAFTYQGRLNDGTNPASGIYDLRFAIYDAAANGTALGNPLTNSSTAITNGLVTVSLDFGNQFIGAARWLEIAVRTNGAPGFNTLSPRQPLSPVPYAVTAGNLASVLLNNNYSTGIASAVSGGHLNNASGNYSTVSGGAANVAAGNLSVIAGGGGNQAYTTYGTVGGGSANVAGSYAVVSGGEFNSATGDHAVIPGGLQNTSDGFASFAAGTFAQANHDGTFVWSDRSTFTPFASTAANQFLIRAAGGVGIGTANPAAQLQVNGVGETFVVGGNPHAGGFTALSVGTSSAKGGYAWLQAIQDSGTNYGNLILNPILGRVGIGQSAPTSELDVNGTVTCTSLNQTSDRNLKQDFAAVNAEAILARVVSLPVSQWSYQSDPATRHIGPMAQDFYSAFNIGTDNRHIATVDEGGVALAAIQGVNRKLEVSSLELGNKNRQAEDRIQRLESENRELNARLEKLEKLINSQK